MKHLDYGFKANIAHTSKKVLDGSISVFQYAVVHVCCERQIRLHEAVLSSGYGHESLFVIVRNGTQILLYSFCIGIILTSSIFKK